MKVRKKLASIYLFLTISLILVNTSTIAMAQDTENTGTIHGQVTMINNPLADQNVSLSKLQNNTFIVVANATTDYNGNYTFEKLALEETYLVSLVFQGVPYSKEVNFGNQTFVQIDFTVYETTTSDADMKVRLSHFVVKLEEGQLRIFEDAVYINTGLQVFNNSQLKAWLPSDTYDFKTSVMGCCVQQSEDNVLFDPMDPIKPNGTYYMWMEYSIKISSSEQQFKKKIEYDTEQFYLIIEKKPGVTAEITDGLVNKSRIIKRDNVGYTVFNGTNLKANSTIVVKFTGLSAPQNYGLLFLWAIIPLILGIGFFVYPIVRKSTSEKKTLPHDLEAQKMMLFEEIAKLDSEYAAGKISKEKYEKLKSKHKEKVIAIIQQIEESRVTQLTSSISRTPILTELYAEEQALISTLHKLDKDHEKGLVSAESYRKMKSKFEHRRAEVIEKIKELEKIEKEKTVQR